MSKRRLHMWSGIFGASLFVIACSMIFFFLLGDEHDVADIALSMKALPAGRLLAAIGLAIAAYGALIFYDIMACKYAGVKVHWARAAAVSCIGYAFNNNLGASNVGGGSVRLRFYARWGAGSLQIAQIIIFCGFSLWLGLGALVGLLLTIWPADAATVLPMPTVLVRPLGWLLLALVGFYALLCLVRRRPFVIRGREVALPSPWLMVGQFIIGIVDWIVCALVLFLLLPAHADIDFTRFLALFLLGHGGGGLSLIPGGWGVFELIMLQGLRGVAPTGQLLSALLVYRAIYYLFPLAIAGLAMAGHELWIHRRHLRRWRVVLWNWLLETTGYRVARAATPRIRRLDTVPIPTETLRGPNPPECG